MLLKNRKDEYALKIVSSAALSGHVQSLNLVKFVKFTKSYFSNSLANWRAFSKLGKCLTLLCRLKFLNGDKRKHYLTCNEHTSILLVALSDKSISWLYWKIKVILKKHVQSKWDNLEKRWWESLVPTNLKVFSSNKL